MAPLLVDKEGVSILVQGREHLPPHVHACYGEEEALVDIRTGEMFEGYVPNKKLKVVQEWLAEGENRAKVEENFYELNPRHRPKKAEEEKPTVKKVVKKNKKKGEK
jgi:hypothetical protein